MKTKTKFAIENGLETGLPGKKETNKKTLPKSKSIQTNWWCAFAHHSIAGITTTNIRCIIIIIIITLSLTNEFQLT